jgi:hypothetical protein
MADVEVRYEIKTVTTVRGMERRSITKWEKEGWEFVSQTPVKLLRTTLSFRRPKKQVSKWVWLAAAAVVVLAVVGVIVGAINERSDSADNAASSVALHSTPHTHPSPAASVEPSATTTAAAVTDAQVLSVFRSYFTERAANGVMYGKAVSGVTFENRVLRVTFDPATAGVDEATFDSLAAHFNFPEFAATPIAFNDDVGNRLRPAIDSIETVRENGTSLGTVNAAQILALNGLSK